ncbi:acyl-CoA-like ligand-binding transcription factor [Sorangium sp. So ce381]|uniref:acyl-CoA-like ligand-binding transcription factor n=1 Tax=Sorangium sp. So ce381 TaxID=3133307 RepID=UPI003F5C93A1
MDPAEAICEPRTGRMRLDPQRDLAPRVLASCALAIVERAIEAWIARGATEDLLELVDEASGRSRVR